MVYPPLVAVDASKRAPVASLTAVTLRPLSGAEPALTMPAIVPPTPSGRLPVSTTGPRGAHPSSRATAAAAQARLMLRARPRVVAAQLRQPAGADGAEVERPETRRAADGEDESHG